jgi:O-antigen/teichoic acid export membrane protein
MIMRLLSPEDYGLFGMAIVFVSVAQMFSEFGIGSTVIAMQGLEPEDEAQLHTASALLGGIAFLATLAAAYPISLYYKEPRVVALVVVLGVPLFLNSVTAVPLARVTKALDYAGMAIVDLLRSIMGALISLAIALAGAGVWALVGGQIAAALAATAFLLVRSPTPFRPPQISRIKNPLKYSREILVDRVAWMIYSGMPAIIGGRLLGPEGLGVYVFAFTLASMPGEKLVNIITSVATPLLARAQNDAEQLRSLLAKLVEGIAVVTWPLLVGLALVSSLLIEVVFGERWRNAEAGLEILSLYFIIRVVMTPFSQVFLVARQARRNRQLSVLGALVLPPAFFVGAHLAGPTGLAFAWWVAVPIFLAPSLVLLKRLVGFGPSQFVRALSRSAFCTVLMATAVILSMSLVKGPGGLRLAYAVTAGAIVYLAAIFCVKGSEMRRLLAEYRKAHTRNA